MKEPIEYCDVHSHEITERLLELRDGLEAAVLSSKNERPLLKLSSKPDSSESLGEIYNFVYSVGGIPEEHEEEL